MSIYNEYEAVIGLEVHVELKTETKMFCSCSCRFGEEENTLVCPVCLGLPGAMPTLNAEAVRLGVRAGLATGCEIALYSAFDRKNYFYPDLPKAYQITQFDYPLCKGGKVIIDTENAEKTIGITRIHLEEDAGKLNHDNSRTLIDCNRCSVPLIEIVSEPDIRNAEEAKEYLRELRKLLLYAGVSDCKMNEGSLRCDVNLSVRKKGETALGVRTEMKNLNSFQFVGKAIEYEFCRQVDVIEAGEKIIQETRRYDMNSGKTYSMRTKENANDYRFFPEPDLPPLILSEEYVEKERQSLPPLPRERVARYIREFGIPEATAKVICSEMAIADYFEECLSFESHPLTLANLIVTELMALNTSEIFHSPISPKNLSALSRLRAGGAINSQVTKMLVSHMWENDSDPVEKVEKEGLATLCDRDQLMEFVKAAVAKSEKAVADYKKGKESAAKSIIGKAMGESRGRADPKIIEELVLLVLREI